MTSITESFRRRITNAELVLPLVDDTLPQVRIRLDLLKEMLDEIDAEHERRMEQAVEATLGRGTCRAVYSPNGVYCSVCHGGGLTIPRHGVNALRNYCPNCGRKVDGRKVVDE